MNREKKFRPLRVFLRLIAGLLAFVLLAAAALLIIPMTEQVEQKTTAGSEDWMADLDDALHLNEIVLPGTHDSATQYVQLAFFSKCQALSVGEQLAAGYRYLDIRLGFADTGAQSTRLLKLMHGFTNCKTGPMPWSETLYLHQVLEACFSFLKDHPTETVIFAVKQEHGEESVSEFETWLDSELRQNEDLMLLTDRIPTLGEARGKLVLMRRYADEAELGPQAGLSFLWADQSGHEDVKKHIEANDNGAYRLWVQDRYEYGAEDKWTAFVNGLKEPAVGAGDLAIHFLSTKGTLAYGHPYYFAGILNKRLLELPVDQLSGWIIVDFADAELAAHIWSANQR